MSEKTLNRPIFYTLMTLTAGPSQAFADSAGEADTSAEPAGFFLMIIGLAALLLGMRNLRELRHKRMAPPRPHQAQRAPDAPAKSDND